MHAYLNTSNMCSQQLKITKHNYYAMPYVAFHPHYYTIYSHCNCLYVHTYIYTLKVTSIALSSCTQRDNIKDSPRPIQVCSEQLN